MGYRTILLENETTMKLKLNNLIIERDGEEFWIPMSDIEIIVIDNLQTTVTTRMLSQFAEYDIGVVICDNSHLPIGYYNAYDNHSRSVKMLKFQLARDEKEKDMIWQRIVQAKIVNQKQVLKRLNATDEKVNKLADYVSNINPGDPENREGHAAKEYFSCIGGTGFSRGNDSILFNSGLNYGYAVLRSYLAKLCVSSGLNTQLGLHHKNEYNRFNLVDDLIEPFRPFVDYYVKGLLEGEEFFKPNHRHKIINMLNHQLNYKNKRMFVSSVMQEYIQQIANWHMNGKDEIVFPSIDDYVGESDEI